jgi:hypothetical protein
MNRTEQDNSRERMFRRPCAEGCGKNTKKHDVCFACRDSRQRARKALRLNLQHGKACHQCEGQPWRRPEQGKCKCGKRFTAEVIARDAGLQRNASIFECTSTRV